MTTILSAGYKNCVLLTQLRLLCRPHSYSLTYILAVTVLYQLLTHRDKHRNWHRSEYSPADKHIHPNIVQKLSSLRGSLQNINPKDNITENIYANDHHSYRNAQVESR